PALLIVNALWTRIEGTRLTDVSYDFELPPSAEEALNDHLDAGGPVLATHTAAISFATSAAWRRAIGVHWDWATSTHPPYGELEIQPPSGYVAGFSGPIRSTDELYTGLSIDTDAHAVAQAKTAGMMAPCLWVGERDGRRWAYSALGHDTAIYG